ncbi:MAG: hypothetical protein AB1485_05730 [Candidatus Thermoplasmatota archaeon]
MRYKEPKAMEEIHKIRERHYKKTKNLSIEERIAQTYKVVDEVLKERNLAHLLVGERKRPYRSKTKA